MIVRQALFEGTIRPGREQAFRGYVEEKLVPCGGPFQASGKFGCSMLSTGTRGASLRNDPFHDL